MKKRLDLLLLEKGYFDSRQKAIAVIMAGDVYIDNQKADKAGQMVNEGAKIEVREQKNQFVSRGGLKLLGAIEHFKIDLKDVNAIDIGASTGGFTDCMLSFGAKKVYCVDVGYGQLAWKLRCDERVVNIERTNIRHIDYTLIKEPLDFGTIDVAFISLKLVLPVLYNILKDNGQAVCLIKPQFEAGRGKVGKKGVVRDKNVHIEVLETVLNFTVEQKFKILGVYYSPITGPEGNIEYLMYIEKTNEKQTLPDDLNIEEIVEISHKNFKDSEVVT